MPKAASSSKSSTRSKAAATRHRKPNQMEVDTRSEDISSPSNGSPSLSSSAPANDERLNEQELILPASRLSRLPKVPSSSRPSTPFPTAAISAHQKTSTTSTSGQDVPSINTSSTVSPVIGQSSPLETSVSGYSPLLTQHGLKHPIRNRLRTSAVFSSSKDLAAHYGIPQVLPPAPRPNYLNQQHPVSNEASAFLDDFKNLCSSYTTMLSTDPTDNTAATDTTNNTASSSMPPPSVGPELKDQDFLDYLVSPEFHDADSFEQWTSPAPALMHDFDSGFESSPLFSPYDALLTTPLVGEDAMLTSPEMGDMPLFPPFEYPEPVNVGKEVAKNVKPSLDVNTLYTMSPSPNVPLLDSFDSPQLYTVPRFPSSFQPMSPLVTNPPTTADSSNETQGRRRTTATGIRKGITPEALLKEDAPTQPRKYVIPSATSRKEVPAVFARKRSRSTAFGDEEDQLDELPPNPTERDLIEQKRRQNTVAARRSRKRKLEQFQTLEKERDEEKRMKEIWMAQYFKLAQELQNHGIHVAPFVEPEAEL